MVNRNMMLGEGFEDDTEAPAKETYAPEPDDNDELIDNIQQGEIRLKDSPFLCDPFSFLRDDPDIENELLQSLQSQGEDTELFEDATFAAEITVSEDTQNRIFDIIDGCRDVLRTFNEGISDSGGIPQDKAAALKSTAGSEVIRDVIVSNPRRKYTNKATFERAKFGQVEDADPPVLPKLIVSAVITLVVAAYFGVMANSYYLANEDKHYSALKCTIGWLTKKPPVSLSPFLVDIFFISFGIVTAVMAAIILLIWDNSSQKKARREGKEHGNARFATMSDYKKYRQRHMDIKR